MAEQIEVAEDLFLRSVTSLRLHSQKTRSAGRRFSREIAVELLQSVLAAEVTCVMRYTLLSVSEEGLRNAWLATEFQAQAADERRHMALLARRIDVLGGVPDFNPNGLAGRMAAFSRCSASFATRLQQNLAAERCVVEHYRDLIAYFEPHDPETAEILQDILQDEENHTGDMQDLLISCA